MYSILNCDIITDMYPGNKEEFELKKAEQPRISPAIYEMIKAGIELNDWDYVYHELTKGRRPKNDLTVENYVTIVNSVLYHLLDYKNNTDLETKRMIYHYFKLIEKIADNHLMPPNSYDMDHAEYEKADCKRTKLFKDIYLRYFFVRKALNKELMNYIIWREEKDEERREKQYSYDDSWHPGETEAEFWAHED